MSVWSTERTNDPQEALRTAFQGLQAGLWTCEPGVIQGPLAADGTAPVALATQGQIANPDGTTKWVNIATFPKCPVVFFGGNGLFMTCPVAEGDDCLVIFARRCIDGWWQSGGTGNRPVETHLHDINDGFCIPGVFSKPRALSNVSMSSIQLRTVSDVLADFAPELITFKIPVKCESTLDAVGEITALSGTGGSVGLATHLTTNAGGSGLSGPPEGGT